MKAFVINFSGGEVLLRDDFFEVASCARENNFAIKIFTNGTLLGYKEVQKIKKLKPLLVEVSVFSSKPEVHDTITGVRGSWEKSVRAVRLLKKHLRVRLKCTLMRENFSSFITTLDFVKQLGVPFQFNPVLMPGQNGSSDVVQHSLNEQECEFIIKHLPDSWREQSGRTTKRNALMCSAGVNSLTIDAYGNLMPCVAFPTKLGNALRDDIEKIWFTNRLLQNIRNTRNKDLFRCRRCDCLEHCSRCPGLALSRRGDYRFPYEDACRIARNKQRFAEMKYKQ
jgi:radical SAM protein with 4Fe4S-binding SPASM domain